MNSPYQYFYLKKEPRRVWDTKLLTRAVSVVFILAGLVLLANVAWPLISWQLFYAPKFQEQKVLGLVSPLPEGLKDVQVKTTPEGFSYFTRENTSTSSAKLPDYQEFLVTIRKLKIEKAVTRVNSEDFLNSLAHFPGTALPGEIGNVFITGHSILPQFFNPQNYKTIFSTLSNLDISDEIIVETPTKTYRYQVINLRVVDPADVSVIAPPDNYGRYLTLMTCVPPGLNTKRLIVLTRLVGEE